MARPQHYFDWQGIVDERSDDDAPASTRDRARIILAVYGLALAAIFARAVQLEISDGAEFRRLAALPVERSVALAAPRGRILARDGSVLAADRQAPAVAMQYRYLQLPPDPQWLRRLARSRLKRVDRRDATRLAAAERAVRDELAEMHRHLARLCGLTDDAWRARIERIDRRVSAMAESVNRRRLDHYHERAAESVGELGCASIAMGLFAPPDELPPVPLVIAEQTAWHPVVEDVGTDVAREIESNPQRYPGVKIVSRAMRDYPHKSLAAHLVGHVRRLSPTETGDALPAGDVVDERAGQMGAEREFDERLRGRPGEETRHTDHRGQPLAVARVRDPRAGEDVVLSIDWQLQRVAETGLDRTAQRLRRHEPADSRANHGGALVVIDVRSGELLAAASTPRFDPGLFAAGDPGVSAILADPRQPMFERVGKMALPPGSVFKPLTALALVERGIVNPTEPFRCQGYLEDPDRLRCQIFRRHGVGHGDVTLADALAQSCNVYFFHHATRLGGAALVDWAGRCGFGRPTGVHGMEEAAGQLPDAGALRQPSQTQFLAIGQGAVAVTPLQLARMYAAIANGGHLVSPRLVLGGPASVSHAENQCSSSTRIAGLSQATIAAVHRGLVAAVEDPNGSAFEHVRLANIAIAGKSGTAETGGNQEDHAWFAGYVPAEAPRYAFVVVVEHAGSGATVAGSLAKEIVQKMQELGYLESSEPEPLVPPTAQRAIPPGKG